MPSKTVPKTKPVDLSSSENHSQYKNVIEVAIMLYTYDNDSWCKLSELNQLVLKQKGNAFFIEIIPVIESYKPLIFSVDSSLNYKKYSNYFHRIRAISGSIYGLLFLTTRNSMLPGSLLSKIEEIKATGVLSNAPEKPIKCAIMSSRPAKNLFNSPKEPSKEKKGQGSRDRFPRKKGAAKERSKSRTMSSGTSKSSNRSGEWKAFRKIESEPPGFSSLHVEWDEHSKTLIGLPEEWEKKILSCFCLPYKYLDKEKVPGYASEIPKILVALRASMRTNGALDKEGIFRVSGESSQVQEVVKAINSKKKWECKDPYVLAHVMKKFYRELPVQVIRKSLFNMFLTRDAGSAGHSLEKIGKRVCHDSTSPEQYLNFCKEVISKIDEPYKTLFYFIVDFCVEIESKASTNKMGAENLSIIISPNLYKISVNMKQMEVIRLATEVKQFVERCIIYRKNKEI